MGPRVDYAASHVWISVLALARVGQCCTNYVPGHTEATADAHDW